MNPIFRIIAFTKQYWKWYIATGLFVIVISALSLAGPLLSKQVVDLIVAKVGGSSENFSKFYLLLALIIASDVLVTVLTAVGQWIGDIFTVKLQTYLARRFYEHVLSLHIGYFDNEITGQIVNRMYRGIESITNFIQNMLNNFLPFFLTALVTIFLLAHYSLVISFLLAILFPIYVLISHGSSLNWMKYEDKKNAINDQSQGRVFESITGIRVVKSFAAELAELKAFITARLQIENLAKKQTGGWHLYDFYRRLVLNIILFGIYSYVVYQTFLGQFTIGEMTLLVQLVQQAQFPLFAMSFILGQIQRASAGSKDYFALLETKSEVKNHPGAHALTLPHSIGSKPLIVFDKVTFEYEKNKEVLHDISFTIQSGEKFALVGESGQGKSTIVNLLLRYYEPQKGTITIADNDITTLTQNSLHQHIAVVFQESLLFSGSIMENIKYGKPNATEEEVIAAAKAANAHDFILELSDGYNSLIGERGVKLSGGQKQRISIARAIIKDAPIILLDEATSSLDSKAELEVQTGLKHLLKGRTAIIIAHRLSTIASSDHILVIEKGEIAQFGSHAELLKEKDGLYAQLVHLQEMALRAPTGKDAEKLKAFDIVG
jgi:ATP-binding cassette, subfamily B, bacterial